MENSIIFAIVGSLIGILGAAIGIYVSLKKEPEKKKEIAVMAVSFTAIVLVHCCIQILASGPLKIFAAIAYAIILIGFILYWKRKASHPDWSHSNAAD